MSGQKFYEGLVNPQAMANMPGYNGSGDRKYYVHPVIIVKNQYIEANCNEIMFYNQGNGAASPTGSSVSINGIILAPGIGLSIPGNYGEIDTTKWQCVFDNTGVNNLVVIRKTYTT